MSDDILTQIKPTSNEKVLIITVGNPIRGDDGIGAYIGDNLKVKNNIVFLLNALDRIENVFEDAVNINPDLTIFIDAADFKGLPGELRIIDPRNIKSVLFSSHKIPINVVSEYLERNCRSKILILGIQIKHFGINEEISQEVLNSANKIVRYFNEEILV